ncbi:hypothetical protein OHQ88_33900 (plasmid) [Micromonospora zamorensis]|uniref:hypothetical protein n=1 Tax=Micromonospora zamorensis TaxID=709883 RepID=UPI002E1C7366
MLLKAYAAVTARLQEIRHPDTADRGDSPVSTAVIVALLAAAAVAVATAITAAANGWVARIPR